jgi:magnesium-transporting ATPase (P-type)
MDNEIKKLTKKYESNMIISGRGMLFLGLWSVFKLVVGYIFGADEIADTQLDLPEIDEATTELIVWLIIAATCLVIMLFCLYVGIKAIRYGRGIKRKKGFLVIVVIIGVLNIVGIPGYFTELNASDWDSAIASALVDLTFASMSFDMVYSAIRLGMLNKKKLKEA